MLMHGTLGTSGYKARGVETDSGARPMSQISAIFGTDDDQEILTSLYLIANVSATGADPFLYHLLTCFRTRMASG